MQKHYYFTALLLSCSFLLHATHNRSGEIIYKKTGALTVEATILTYTKASSVNADRDSLDLQWGDGTVVRVPRSNGNGVIVGPDLKKNTYTSSHTYLAEGVYTIWMTDNNRTAGIINLNPPSSDNIAFHLEATIRLLPDAASSLHSPIFLDIPVDAAYTFQPYSHVVNAFDPDGDSLAFELVVPMQNPGELVPNYSFPDQISPSDDNKVFFNAVTGQFFWDSPITPGHYCIAILVKAYRNGLLVETTRRDMSIDVEPEANYAPVIVLLPEVDPLEVVPVTVGQTIGITVNASDPDAGQLLVLTATGGPFEDIFQEKATFTVTGNTGVFSWKIKAEHARSQPYQVVFKAKDNFLDNGLSSTRIVRFQVNGVTAVQQPRALPQRLKISPNPATDAIVIQLPEIRTNAATLRLFDAQGNLLRSTIIPAGINNTTWTLAGLPKGYYSIDLHTTGGRTLVGSVLKME